MISDEKKREMAQRLRDSWKKTWHGEKMMHRLRETLGIDQLVAAYGKYRYYKVVAERLADLIEPNPESTCRMDLTETDTHEVTYRTWECSECGQSCEELYGAYEYCPHCGRRVVQDGN